MSNSYPFPHLRSLALRILNWLFPPDAPTVADTEGRINEAREEERRRLSHSLQHAPTATPDNASVFVSPITPAIAQSSPEPPQRATGASEPFLRVSEPLAAQQMLTRHWRIRLAQREEQVTSLTHSIRVARLVRAVQTEHAPTLHTLPVPPRWMQAVIDGRSRETPPQEQPAIDWNCFGETVQEDEDTTEEMSAMRKLAKGRF